jgi:hypothetical protein
VSGSSGGHATSKGASGTAAKPVAKKRSSWIMYVALILAGLILIAEAFGLATLNRWTAKIGIALLYTALAYLVGQDRVVATIGVVIVWAAVILTLVL